MSQFTICMVNFGMIYYMKFRFSLSSGTIGIASSIYTVTYFVSCLLLEKPLCKVGRKTKAVLSLCGMGLSHLLILLSPSSAFLYPLLAFYGVAMSLLWPNVEAWMTEGDDDAELAKSVSAFNFSWSFGAGLSTMAGGLLVELGASVAVAVGVVLFFATALVLVPMKSDGCVSDGPAEKDRPAVDRSTDLRYLCWTGIFLSYSCYSLMINIFPLYAYDNLGFSEGLTGILLLARGLVSCFFFLVFSRMEFWKFSFRTIIASQCALGILFMAFALVSGVVSYAVCFMLFGIVFSLVYDLSIFHGAAGAVDKDRRMVIHEVLINVGQVLGSILGGIVYEHVSFQAILYFLAILAIILATSETLAYVGFHRRAESL